MAEDRVPVYLGGGAVTLKIEIHLMKGIGICVKGAAHDAAGAHTVGKDAVGGGMDVGVDIAAMAGLMDIVALGGGDIDDWHLAIIAVGKGAAIFFGQLSQVLSGMATIGVLSDQPGVSAGIEVKMRAAEAIGTYYRHLSGLDALPGPLGTDRADGAFKIEPLVCKQVIGARVLAGKYAAVVSAVRAGKLAIFFKFGARVGVPIGRIGPVSDPVNVGLGRVGQGDGSIARNGLVGKGEGLHISIDDDPIPGLLMRDGDLHGIASIDLVVIVLTAQHQVVLPLAAADLCPEGAGRSRPFGTVQPRNGQVKLIVATIAVDSAVFAGEAGGQLIIALTERQVAALQLTNVDRIIAMAAAEKAAFDHIHMDLIVAQAGLQLSLLEQFSIDHIIAGAGIGDTFVKDIT